MSNQNTILPDILTDETKIFILSTERTLCRVFVHELSGCGYESRCCHLNSDILPVLSKEFLDIQATIECKFTLKHVHNMIITYSQLHLTDKYSQHSSIIWPVWLNGWVFVYQVSGCKNKSHCCHLNFTNRVCFKQGFPWHSGNCRLYIHSRMRSWHDNNIQTLANFIWKNTPSKMKHKTLILEHKHGGLKFEDVTCKIMSLLQWSWINRFYDKSFHELKIVLLFYIKRHLTIIIDFIPI